MGASYIGFVGQNRWQNHTAVVAEEHRVKDPTTVLSGSVPLKAGESFTL